MDFENPKSNVRGGEDGKIERPGEDLLELNTARCSLYGSHFLSAWGSRMWEFTIGLVSIRLYDSGSPVARPGSQDCLSRRSRQTVS